jgi:hypothetical protein
MLVPAPDPARPDAALAANRTPSRQPGKPVGWPHGTGLLSIVGIIFIHHSGRLIMAGALAKLKQFRSSKFLVWK